MKVLQLLSVPAAARLLSAASGRYCVAAAGGAGSVQTEQQTTPGARACQWADVVAGGDGAVNSGRRCTVVNCGVTSSILRYSDLRVAVVT